MNNQKKLAARLFGAVWPVCFVSSGLFLAAKFFYPQVDWAVVVCAILLFIVGIQLRAQRTALLADTQD